MSAAGDGAVFPWGQRTCLMAILNVTPNSFSGDGLAGDVEAALQRARQAAAAGADVIDVGGESTAYYKPGYMPVTEAEELARVLPVIERLAGELALPISIDTRKPEVARRALRAGAAWVNNVEAVWDDGAMATVAAEHQAPLVIMHYGREARYTDVVREVRDSLERAAELALGRGVDSARIILDPGIGFGKGTVHNLTLLRRLSELRSLGFPLLIGPSRKRFLGELLGGAAESDRLEGTEA
ncbi:MAG: dihydropteroate synthase, partial [Chloroflexota bacterium]